MNVVPRRAPLPRPALRKLVCAASLLLACGCGLTALAGAPTVQDLVNQFDATNYFNLVSSKLYTRQGMNRAPLPWGAQHDPCRDAIFDEFQRAGLNPAKDFFSYVDTTNTTPVNACNVITVKEGMQNPDDEIYVVGSHYDSKNNPGADDNATGVACQLEMARIFSQCHFAKTLVFVAFDAEERWATNGEHRLGSVRYADQHRTDNIQGVVSVDMIGWQAPSPNSNTAAVYGRPTIMDPIRSDLRAALTNYGGLNVSLPTSTGDISDHVAFANAGFQACLLIEANYSSNPNYHKATDYVEYPGYLDWAYLARMCQGVIGFFATKLQPVDVTPTVVSVRPGTNGAMVIEFTGLPGCQYATELTTNLSSPVWTAIVTNTASTNDGTFQAVDALAGGRPTGFYRARFVAGYVGTPPPTVIVDNPAATVVGAWSTGTSSTDKYGTDYRFASPGSGATYVEFRPNLSVAGNYRVFEWHPAGTNRTSDAPIEITHSGGTQTVRINQQTNGGQWLLLGTFDFASGTGGYVRITDKFTTGSVVLADAVKFVAAP